MVTEITENEFNEKISKGKVLVDCYAPWCGPCRMLGPIIDAVASENKEYSFYKLNVDDSEEVAVKYGIMSIPCLLVFENGELKETSIGLKSKDEVEELLK